MNVTAGESELLFLDTETTGNGPEDRLCQVAYKVGENMVVKNFKPPLPISVKAMSVTHITNKMVENEEAFSGSDTQKELQALLGTHILVAHNAKFDIAMLTAEGMTVPRHICTLRLARYLDTEQEIPEYGLQYLRYYFDVETDAVAHSAEGDVEVLEAVFDHLYTMAKERAPGTPHEEIIARMVDISGKPSLIKKFTFGKHIGKSVAEVATSDRGYLEWLLRTKLQDDPDDEDWLFTLRKVLGGQ